MVTYSLRHPHLAGGYQEKTKFNESLQSIVIQTEKYYFALKMELLFWIHIDRLQWNSTLTISFSPLCSVDFVKWSSQGMLRMSPEAMNSLFKPTIDHIIQHLCKLH